MVCLECGRMIELGTKFCPYCGKATPLNNDNNSSKRKEDVWMGYTI